ncbi:MAG: acetyl-CoA carboxylase biotin carboxyl carrier protein [Gemmatimonadales bacterium]|nr:MAG: acetyl-CoA carboxylase biotin carboxyl carrier protein [Gemmatimonadales bacterium]
MIDLDWIRQLIDLVDESDIDSLEISRFGTRVRVSKSPTVHIVGGGSAYRDSAGSAGGPGDSAITDRPLASSGHEESPVNDSIVHVTSPMVGTFYRSPAPDAPPYVEVGDRIQKGQTLCILEAMKLMNELEAEFGGTVREICVGNGDPVEYGQAIFHIESD